MITLITIGQTPREDLLKAFKIGGVSDFQLVGALDDVSQNEIDMLEKQSGEEKLFVVLKNGMANMNHEIIEQKVENLIKEYEDCSDAIAVLCMSEFTCTSNKTEIIYPIKELKGKVGDIKSNDTTIIFVPIKEQERSAKIKWKSVEGNKHIVTVHPKSETILEEIIREIDLHRPKYVIMDCYGYGYELVEQIENKRPCTCYNAQHLLVQKVMDVIYE
ncbi:AroM family protein [Peribacillus loiseleuriae]|uniref:AroM family protein n=1 Tax=Peribacillus loiseleuriae TaxID=1679170 RepID=UPI003810055B